MNAGKFSFQLQEENSRLQDLLHSATSNAKSSAKELECLKNEVDENNAARW